MSCLGTLRNGEAGTQITNVAVPSAPFLPRRHDEPFIKDYSNDRIHGTGNFVVLFPKSQSCVNAFTCVYPPLQQGTPKSPGPHLPALTGGSKGTPCQNLPSEAHSEHLQDATTASTGFFPCKGAAALPQADHG